MPSSEDFPLRNDAVTAAWASERRPEEDFSGAQTQAWQLVYVRSGAIEEHAAGRRVLLRAGGILLHQPEETFSMRSMGEIPPEVLRIEFHCTGAAMTGSAVRCSTPNRPSRTTSTGCLPPWANSSSRPPSPAPRRPPGRRCRSARASSWPSTSKTC